MIELNSKQKVAVLFLYLGSETSSLILKHLEEYQIEEVAREISKLGTVDRDTINNVVYEFHQILLTKVGSRGGIGYLREVLEKTLGPTKALSLINRISEAHPFTYLKDVPITQLANVLANESPQTIALIMSYINPTQAAGILSHLQEQKQMDVAMRISSARATPAEIVKEMNRAMEKTISSQRKEGLGPIAQGQLGSRVLAEILNRVDRKTESYIMENLSKTNSTLADEVRKHMFIFEDLINLDGRAVQRIIRETDFKDLRMALKLADETVKQKIFQNMSERARAILVEEMSFTGPVRVKQVEEAQQKILETIRRLEAAGEIVIPKRGTEDKLV